MTAFDQWVRGVIGAAPPASEHPAENPVTSAAGNPSDNNTFLDRFGARLARLWVAFPRTEDQKTLMEKLANIGTSGWMGPFAELAAYDFLVRLDPTLRIEVTPTGMVLGEQAGKGRSSLDGMLPMFGDLHVEVKALTDVSARVIASIREQVAVAHPNVLLDFTYPADLGQRDIAGHLRDLVQEISGAILGTKPFVHHQPSGVQVRLHYDRPAVRMAEHDYDPYRQAERWRYAPFEKWHQLVVTAPNLRVMAVHPWFNFINHGDFAGIRQTFFRSLARRVFCDLTKQTEPLSTYVPDAVRWTGTVADAARRLSGILFIVDHTAGREDETLLTPADVMEGYLYENPNTFEPNHAGSIFRHLRDLDESHLIRDYDGFGYDNY
jgi:hypothetical protein